MDEIKTRIDSYRKRLKEGEVLKQVKHTNIDRKSNGEINYYVIEEQQNQKGALTFKEGKVPIQRNKARVHPLNPASAMSYFYNQCIRQTRLERTQYIHNVCKTQIANK